jgi:hypothetical protein
MLNLPFRPLRDGYSFEPLDVARTQELRGGLGRSRLDLVGVVYRVDLRWSLGLADLDRFMAFYRTVRDQGNAAFTVPLVVEGSGVQSHVARFVPGSLRTGDRQATKSVVSASLIVQPNPSSAAGDESLMDLYETYGDGVEAVLNALAKLVNQALF